MLRLRLAMDRQKRTKKGQPPQRTTGVARVNSNQVQNRADAKCSSGWLSRDYAIAEISRGIVKPTLPQNRRLMSVSSEFSSCTAETLRRSSAIPQIGQLPGFGRRTSGCIGHV